MRKMLCISFIAFAAISCKDDDGSPNIKGVWIPIEEAFTGCDDSDDNDVSTYDDNGCQNDVCVAITITSDEITVTFTDDSGVDETTLPYKLKGSAITIMTGGENITYNCKVKANILTLTGDTEGGCVFKGTYKRQ